MACVFYNVPYVFSYKVNLFLQVHIYADKDTFYTKNQMVYLFSFRRVFQTTGVKKLVRGLESCNFAFERFLRRLWHGCFAYCRDEMRECSGANSVPMCGAGFLAAFKVL